LPQGRAAAALLLNEQTKDANDLPFLSVTQWGESIDKIKEAIDKMVKKAVEEGSHRKSEDYRGVKVETIINDKSSILTYCFIDDFVIVSDNVEFLQFVIAHIKGAASPTLADDADYVTTLRAIGPYHDIDLYFNIKQIIKAELAKDTTGQARTTIANLGVDNVAGLGCSTGFARGPGSWCRGKVFLKVNGTKKGICKMLEIESGVLRAPRFIPASFYSVALLNLDIKRAYDEFGNILNKSATEMNKELFPPSPDGQPGVHLKTDIIDHLGRQIVIAQSANKPFTGNSALTDSLIALAVSNRSALEKSLSLLHSKMFAANNPDAKRELLGYTIYLVDVLSMLPAFMPEERIPMQIPLEQGLPQIPTFAFSITDTHLILGTEPTVEQAIRTLSGSESASVSSAKWFVDAKLSIPSVVGLASLEDSAVSGELLWWMMKPFFN